MTPPLRMNRIRRRIAATALALGALLFLPPHASAESPDALLALLAQGKRAEALAAMAAHPEAVAARPDELGKRLFDYREKEILAALGADAAHAKALELAAAGRLDDAVAPLSAAIREKPLAWPLYDLLAILHLSGSRAAGAAVEPHLTAPMRLLWEAAHAAEAGRHRQARGFVDTLLREHRDFLPLYKTLGMFPDTVIDFREKAEFGRRFLREGAAYRRAALAHLLFENALVAALEASQACRRARAELSAEAGLLFDERGALRGDLPDERREKLRCPVGIPFNIETNGPAFACPLHGK